MAGLEELPPRSVPGEPGRRWFSSKKLDLIVWLSPTGSPIGFQLCYDKGQSERAITWTEPDKLTHSQVDSGEVDPLHPKATPILLPDGSFDARLLIERLRAVRGELPDELFALVVSKLEAQDKKQGVKKHF